MSLYNYFFFLLGNDEITLLLIENGADFYLREENWGLAYFGCITRNCKFNLKKSHRYSHKF